MALNVGVIGLGSIGLRHARNFMALGVNVMGYDPDPERAKTLRDTGGMVAQDRAALFNAVDAVVVASPSAHHFDDLDEAISRGLHAFVEKPLVHDPVQAAGLVEEGERKGLVVAAAMNLRHHPGVLALRSVLQKGTCGRVQWARFWFSDYLPRWRPQQDYRTGYTADPATGGILFDRIHEIDLAHHLLGESELACATAHSSGVLDIKAEDTADLILRHGAEVTSNIHVDYCTRARTSICEISAEEGRWLLDLDARMLTHTPADGTTPQVERFKGGYDDDYIAEAQAFLDAISENGPVACSGREALDVLRLVVEARRRCGLPAKGARRQAVHAGPAFTRSHALMERAEKTIPLASQTFSKCYQQYPAGGAPLFVSHGQGGRIWDVDGNNFVDCVGALFPLILGYRDPDVDEAVRRQLDRGISFSLSTALEAEVAERLVELVPSAEKVRFGKNGTDATSAAVRLTRAKTGRDRIAVCGYHGWQDWYIGVTTRHKGIPGAVRELTHTFAYNDLSSLERVLNQHKGEFAAVIMEPMNVTAPAPGFLEGVRDLTHAHGAYLVFDEIITGFRFDVGGAQSVFGVTPDLTSFGKALGNGMPISAIVGRRDVMDEMENVFFSGTYGGEALSLAAARAVLHKLTTQPVIETVKRNGQALADDIQAMIVERGLENALEISGWPSCKFVVFKDHPEMRKEVVRTIFQREMIRAGVLIINAHALSYAHDQGCLDDIHNAYASTLDVLADEASKGQVEARLDIPVIEPVFKVR